MKNLNTDVALVELFRNTRNLGIVSAVNEDTYVVTGISVGLTVLMNANDYQVVPPDTAVTAFYRAELPTEAEAELLARDRLIMVLNGRYNEFVNSNPTLAKVMELAGLLEAFEF